MRAITLQGTEEQISKVQLNSYAFPTEELPTLVETRVYLVDFTKTKDENLNLRALTDEDFIKESERQGTVFTLEGFENAVNYLDFYMDESYIRFINIPINN